MNILPYIGIGDIKFGMTMNDVRSFWGQPENIRYFIPIENNPEERDVIWEYEDSLEFSFSSDDEFLLSTITSSSEKIRLNEVVLVGRDISEVSLDFPTIYLEDDFEETGQSYDIPEFDVTLWVKNGVVDTVLFFPKYDASGNNVIWPS